VAVAATVTAFDQAVCHLTRWLKLWKC